MIPDAIKISKSIKKIERKKKHFCVWITFVEQMFRVIYEPLSIYKYVSEECRERYNVSESSGERGRASRSGLFRCLQLATTIAEIRDHNQSLRTRNRSSYKSPILMKKRNAKAK
ncbi:hypothetical protein AVEN_147662-1 [Araneus ventricosus]|uniref:Uncharacterized protein n=1 Tax=Araneus ventricosus TaxID=182803 RepID=A0A4Y2LT12_ARAVE|nr:hypothetical protein AVEN_147662-1 [Araneus ventricosus]